MIEFADQLNNLKQCLLNKSGYTKGKDNRFSRKNERDEVGKNPKWVLVTQAQWNVKLTFRAYKI